MVETQQTRTSKQSVASISKYYRTDAPYEDVRAFYIKELRDVGWLLKGERSVKDWERDLGGRELRFEMGDYYVTVFYFGERSDTDSKYAIGVSWR